MSKVSVKSLHAIHLTEAIKLLFIRHQSLHAIFEVLHSFFAQCVVPYLLVPKPSRQQDKRVSNNMELIQWQRGSGSVMSDVRFVFGDGFRCMRAAGVQFVSVQH